MQRVVKTETYSGANDVWNDFKAAVQKSDAQALAAESAHASLAWSFLVGFAAEKTLYRNQIIKVVEQLREVPGWPAAFSDVPPETLSRLEKLHATLKEAFPAAATTGGTAPTLESTPAAPAAAPAAAESPPVAAPSDISPPPVEPVPVSTIPLDSLPVPALPLDPSPDAASAAPKTFVQPAEPAIVEDSPVSDHSDYHKKRPPLDSEGPGHKPPPSPASQSPLVKRYKPFIQRANELEADHPVIAHYCRVHAVEQLIYAKRRGETDPESYTLLLLTLEEAERKKKTLNLTLGREDMEAFAYRFYEDAIDNQGSASQFYVAGHLIEVLAQFHGGQLPPALQQVADFCSRRAYEMKDCFRAGKAPPPMVAAPQLPPMGSLQAAGYPAPAAAAPAYQPAPVAPTPAPAPVMPSAPPAAPAPAPAPAPAQAQAQYMPTAPAAHYMPAAPAAAPAPAAPAPYAPYAPAAPVAPVAPAPTAFQAAGTAGVPPPSAADSAAWAGWSATKKQSEARKRCEHASKLLGGSTVDPEPQARRLVTEALQLLEGLK